jgi:hypothetical protein
MKQCAPFLGGWLACFASLAGLFVTPHKTAIIQFPTPPSENIETDYQALERFVTSCCKLLATLPVESRQSVKQEFDQLVEGLVQFLDDCQEARSE